MLQDILAGRPTEIEALNAQVATRGRALGLPTPVNDLLTRLVRAAAQSAPFTGRIATRGRPAATLFPLTNGAGA